MSSKNRPLSEQLRVLGRHSQSAEQAVPFAKFRTTTSATPHNIRVLHVSTLDCGGAGIAAYRLHRGLLHLCVDSRMCVLHKSTNDPTVRWIYGVRGSADKRQAISLWPGLRQHWGETLQRFPGRSQSLCFFSTPDAVVSLDELVQDFDVINLHWVAGFLDIESMPKLFAGKKLFWTLHDMNPFTGGCHYAQDCIRYRTGCHDCPQLGPGPEDIVRAIWNLKLSCYESLDLTVVTPSRWLGSCSQASRLLGRFPHRVIPNGLDLKHYHPVDRSQARQALGLPTEAQVVLFGASAIGDYRKGFDLFLDAIVRLPHLLEGAELILAAFGHSEELGRITTPYKLHHLGHLDDATQLSAAYSAADVFVVPSREDNLPNTVLESLACGTPIVGFDIGGLPDMISHRKTGYLAPFPNVNELAEGIAWVLSQRGGLRSHCRDRAVDEFSLKVQAQRYRDLYLTREILEPDGRRDS